MGSIERRLAEMDSKIRIIENKLIDKGILSAREKSEEITEEKRNEEQLGKFSIEQAENLIKTAEMNIDEDTVKTRTKDELKETKTMLGVAIKKILHDVTESNSREDIIQRFKNLLKLLEKKD